MLGTEKTNLTEKLSNHLLHENLALCYIHKISWAKCIHFGYPFGAIFDAFLSHFWVVNFRPPEMPFSSGDLPSKIGPKNWSKTRPKSRPWKPDTDRDLRSEKWSTPGERVPEMAQKWSKKCSKKRVNSGSKSRVWKSKTRLVSERGGPKKMK